MTQTQDILHSCSRTAEAIFAGGANGGAARDAALYLAHTGKGEGIRTLARATGTHPSTISRAVRRVEDRRDDPLFDHMLSEAEKAEGVRPANSRKTPGIRHTGQRFSDAEVEKEARRLLRRLAEPGAFLLIAPSTAKAGLFCAGNDFKRPVAMLDVDMAAEFLRREWIRTRSRGSASVRYSITDVGRSFLRRANGGTRKVRGEGDTPFRAQHQEMAEKLFVTPSGEAEARPVNLGETPIGWLTRRRGADGKPFLSVDEVDAAERLRTDFELAQIGPSVAQDWRKFLTPGDRLSGTPVKGNPGDGALMARDRVMKALSELGPGLSDVALRTCCFLEGLETCERRMGWSARSGKVVLKLALQRLAEHYGLKVFKD